MDDSLRCISIYGSDDGVLNRLKMEKSNQYLPKDTEKYVIEGGNHCQFGNYGKQFADNDAAITAAEQQKQAVRKIMEWVVEKR